MARLERGEVEEGRRLLEEAWREEPESVERMHGLARALDLAGERARALELLERAHARAPGAPGPACDLAMLLLEHEQEARAEQVLAPVLRAHPEHPRANLHMAMALAKTAPIRARAYAAKALQDSDPELRRQAESLHQALTAHGPR
ncbi:MAG: tetratricopeptide repeat protein [Myxococcaceae bacterium]|nr:tetratricopeptide repeat protein [Myxococcaceae bacterium]